VDRHAEELFRLAVVLVGNATDAEDVLQETFIGALRGLHRFEGRSTVRTWLTGILVRQVARHHRGRGQRKTQVGGELSEASRRLLNGTVPGESQQWDTQIDVLAALGSLSPEHREALALREFQGLTYEEMAETLGVPIGTVESRLHRARRELKEKLGGYMS
jgi:RNA polymerase sigma-70 factor (ECF subfamily)